MKTSAVKTSSQNGLQKFIVRASAVAVFATAVAHATATQLSTKWTLVNDTSDSVKLSCAAAQEAGKSALDLEEINLPAHQHVVHAWSDAWHDGVGLHAASWNCRATQADHEVADAGHFATEPGEDVTLVVQSTGEGLRIMKGAEHANVARAAHGGTDLR